MPRVAAPNFLRDIAAMDIAAIRSRHVLGMGRAALPAVPGRWRGNQVVLSL